MSHIHTEPGQIDHTVTIYVVRTDGEEPKVLLHMHIKHHKLLPFGGHIELDETPWNAVARELLEESGYQLKDLRVLQPQKRLQKLSSAILHPYPIAVNTHIISPDHFHSDLIYALIADQEPGEITDSSESRDLRWLTREELKKLGDSEVFPDTIDAYNFILDTCLTEWEQVPASSFSTSKP